MGRPCASAARPHFPACLRALAEQIDLHPPAARGVEAAERQVDQPFLFRRPAQNHRPVKLVDFALFEQKHQLFQRLADGARARGSRTCPCPADGPVRGRAAGRNASEQNLVRNFRRPWARDGPASPPACRGPISVRREKVVVHKSLPASCGTGYREGTRILRFGRHGRLSQNRKDLRRARALIGTRRRRMSAESKDKAGFLGRLFKMRHAEELVLGAPARDRRRGPSRCSARARARARARACRGNRARTGA